jgi:hypothetical protein
MPHDQLHRLQLSIVDATFRGRRDLIERFFDAQVEDDGCVALHALQLFTAAQLPAPCSDDFVCEVLRGGGLPLLGDGPLARVSFDQCLLLLQGTAPPSKAPQPLPPLGPDASVALIQAHQSAGKRALRAQRRQKHAKWAEGQRLRKKRAALSNVHCTWHPRVWDAAGDNGNVRDKEGRKAACAWEQIHVSTDNSHNQYSAAFVASHPKGSMDTLEKWRPVDALTWADPPPLGGLPDKCVKHIASELQRAVGFAQREFGKTSTKTASQTVAYSQCKSDVNTIKSELTKVRDECARRTKQQRLKRKKAECERKGEGEDGRLPQLVLNSSASVGFGAVNFGSRPPSRVKGENAENENGHAYA